MKDVAIRSRNNFVMKNFWESESTKEKRVECLEFSWVCETAIKAILQVWKFCRGGEMTKRRWYQSLTLYLTINSELLKSRFCKRLTLSSRCNQWTPLSLSHSSVGPKDGLNFVWWTQFYNTDTCPDQWCWWCTCIM